MKRTLALCFVFALLLCGCSSAPPQNTEPIVEANKGIPYETLKAIEDELRTFYSERDNDASIYVSDDDGALDISLNAEGMVAQIVFSDYANALVIQSQELSAKYDLSVSLVSVTFTAGKDSLMNWRTSDCISGTLVDTYDGADLLLHNQTIEDLVDRYGAMNWFYPLSSDE